MDTKQRRPNSLAVTLQAVQLANDMAQTIAKAGVPPEVRVLGLALCATGMILTAAKGDPDKADQNLNHLIEMIEIYLDDTVSAAIAEAVTQAREATKQ